MDIFATLSAFVMILVVLIVIVYRPKNLSHEQRQRET